MTNWTVLKVLRWTTDYLGGKGVDNPRLDAELLIGSALDKDRVGLYLYYDKPLQSAELAHIHKLVARRASREPLQYILGHTEFWSLPFKVVSGVLIPRSDSEILVEEALRLLDESLLEESVADAVGRVLDVGTGSGIIAVAIAHSCEAVRVDAIDISFEALQLAQHNATENKVEERIDFQQQDMANLVQLNGLPYQLIVSNPPYITTDEMAELMPEVLDHEPRLALEAGSDGLDCYRLLCAQALVCLQPHGWIVVEVGATQALAVKNLMEQAGLNNIFTRDDYSGITRVVGGQAPASCSPLANSEA
ncbi:MAG: peptide chain release factor N(5)-glutamine methyltransferase [Thermodesulfobacteriota bacterium]|nr:peptide chain release factor N(5)-glutamine methyltransferase [Thermodesulfobacteriota bacterium]